MKKTLISLLTFVGVSFASIAADNVTVNPSSSVAIINSSLGTTVAYATNNLYPNYIAASTSITNVITIPAGKAKDFSLQFTASAVQTNGGTVTLQIGRSVQGLAATNYYGTTNALGVFYYGVPIEWVGQVSLVLPANTATTPSTVCTNWWSGSGAGTVGGAMGAVYIGWITVPANVTLTNYAVYVNQE